MSDEWVREFHRGVLIPELPLPEWCELWRREHPNATQEEEWEAFMAELDRRECLRADRIGMLWAFLALFSLPYAIVFLLGGCR